MTSVLQKVFLSYDCALKKEKDTKKKVKPCNALLLKELSVDDFNFDLIKYEGFSHECFGLISKGKEPVRENKYTRLFFDFDFKDITDVDKYKNYNNTITEVLKHNSQLYDFVFTDGSYWDASKRKGKISYHIIFRNKYIDCNRFDYESVETGEYLNKIVQGMDEEMSSEFLNSSDKSVYSKEYLRLPYGKQKDKIGFHTPQENTDPSDYLITAIPIEITEFVGLKKEEIKREVKPEIKLEYDEERQLLLEYINDVSKNRFVKHDDWFALLCIMKQNGLPFEEFDRISSTCGYSDYDYHKNVSDWDNLTEREQHYGFGRVYEWLEEDGVDTKLYREKRRNIRNGKKIPSSTDKILQLIKKNEFNDTHLADVVVELMKNDIFSTQDGWLYWTDNGWKITTKDTIISSVIMDKIGRDFQKYFNTLEKEEDEEDEDFKERKKSLEKYNKQLNTLRFFNEIVKTATEKFTDNDIINTFDRQPHLFAFNDMKAIDLNTGKLINIEKSHRITFNCGYSSCNEEETKSKTIVVDGKNVNAYEYTENILKDIFEDSDDPLSDYKCALSVYAQSLVGQNTNQIFTIHTGNSSNGKSIVILLNERAFGNYAGNLPIPQLVNPTNAKDEINTGMSKLRHKRYTHSDEPSNDCDDDIKKRLKLQDDTMKLLTGDSKIVVRGMYKASIDMPITFGINIYCNKPPNSTNLDDAIKRRTEIIEYKYKFTDKPNKENNEKQINRNLKDIINKYDEIRDSMLWILINAYKKNGSNILRNKKMEDKRSEYFNSHNPFYNFFGGYMINNEIKDFKTESISHKDLYADYKVYCTENDIDRPASTNLLKKNVLDYFNGVKNKPIDKLHHYGLKKINN